MSPPPGPKTTSSPPTSDSSANSTGLTESADGTRTSSSDSTDSVGNGREDPDRSKRRKDIEYSSAPWIILTLVAVGFVTALVTALAIATSKSCRICRRSGEMLAEEADSVLFQAAEGGSCQIPPPTTAATTSTTTTTTTTAATAASPPKTTTAAAATDQPNPAQLPPLNPNPPSHPNPNLQQDAQDLEDGGGGNETSSRQPTDLPQPPSPLSSPNRGGARVKRWAFSNGFLSGTPKDGPPKQDPATWIAPSWRGPLPRGRVLSDKERMEWQEAKEDLEDFLMKSQREALQRKVRKEGRLRFGKGGIRKAMSRFLSHQYNTWKERNMRQEAFGMMPLQEEETSVESVDLGEEEEWEEEKTSAAATAAEEMPLLDGASALPPPPPPLELTDLRLIEMNNQLAQMVLEQEEEELRAQKLRDQEREAATILNN